MSISSDTDSFKDVLWEGVKQLTKGQEIYEETLRILQSKKAEPIPQSKDPSLQEELTKIHTIYLQWIESSIVNTKAQCQIEQELKDLFERDFDPMAFSTSLTKIQSRLNPLLSQHQEIDAAIKQLEDRISVLIKN
jgi:hypothetical protein